MCNTFIIHPYLNYKFFKHFTRLCSVPENESSLLLGELLLYYGFYHTNSYYLNTFRHKKYAQIAQQINNYTYAKFGYGVKSHYNFGYLVSFHEIVFVSSLISFCFFFFAYNLNFYRAQIFLKNRYKVKIDICDVLLLFINKTE